MLVAKVAKELRLLARESHPLVLGARAARYWEMYNVLRRYLEKYLGTIRDKTILDFGCGIRSPMTKCLADDGAFAIGIDPKLGSVQYGSRRERFLRHTLYTPLVHKRFLRALRYASNRSKLLDHAPPLLVADGENLPFKSETFDGAISFSVMEHVMNLDAVLRELARVLKPDGVCAHQFHLYRSMTGGHNIEYDLKGKPVFGNVPPWAHLRGYKDKAVSGLNRLREADFREAFERFFEILEWDLEKLEGEEWLTPQIEEELDDYDRDELLRRSIFVVVRLRGEYCTENTASEATHGGSVPG